MKCYDIQNKTPDSAVIYIYEPIGQDWLGEGLTSKSFAEDIAKLGPVKEINIRIDCIGGSVFDARAMASVLRAHKAKKIVDIDSLCASASTYIACAGDVVRIAEDGIYMLHPPMGRVDGYASEMRKQADVLDVIKSGMVEIYMNRTRRDALTIEKLIQDESWLTAKQAVEYGFADSISKAMRLTNKVDLSKMPNNRLPFTIPEQFKGKFEIIDAAAKAESDALREQLARNRQRLAMYEMGRK